MEKGQAKHVFPGGNTPKGFYSLYHEGLTGLNRIFILKGGPGVGKSTLMRELAELMLDNGYDTELWQCSSDNDSLDGVVVPALGIGIIDGTAPHTVDPRYPGAVDEIINLGDCWREEMLTNDKDKIIKLTNDISALFKNAYMHIAEAGKIYQKSATGCGTDIQAQIRSLRSRIFGGNIASARHLFSAAITPRGLVSYADSISNACKNRYLLGGNPCAEIAPILSGIAVEAMDKGYKTELYHNCLAPESLDMVVIIDKSTAIIDNTLIHKNLIRRESDIIIDLQPPLPGTDSTKTVAQELEKPLKEAFTLIMQAKRTHDELEKYYIDSMDFTAVDKLKAALFKKISSIISKQA